MNSSLRIIGIFLLSSFIFMTCKRQKEEIDILVYNGKIYLVDESFSKAEAMAIKDGKILKTGNSDNLSRKYNAKKVINLKGRSVYPGFIDAHCHFYGLGVQLLKYANLKGTASMEEIINRLKAHEKKNPSEWLVGMGWDQNNFADKRFPERSLLDEEYPNKAVMLVRIDGHAILANSRALESVGYTVDTKMQGGQLLVEKGELSGILIDKAADILKEYYQELDNTDAWAAILEAQKYCFRLGLTSVTDAGLDKDVLRTMEKMIANEEMKMRVFAMLTPTPENIDHYVKKGIKQEPYLHIRSLKLYADGALGSRGGLLIEPYTDMPDSYGLQVYSTDSMKEICEIAYKHNYQVCTHAIGDSANRLMLHLYASFLKGKNDRRWRIEHAQIVHPEDFELFGKYSIIPSVQATHATSDMDWAIDRLGSNRIKYAYAYKDLLKQNSWIPNGTDFPIEEVNPMYTFYASVARKDLDGNPKDGFQKENALNREETMRSMTIWAAKAAFEEECKGSLETGKFADFVILDKDIMKIPEAEIPEVKVISTFVNGEEVYTAP